jgi:hypothetical protein
MKAVERMPDALLSFDFSGWIRGLRQRKGRISSSGVNGHGLCFDRLFL